MKSDRLKYKRNLLRKKGMPLLDGGTLGCERASILLNKNWMTSDKLKNEPLVGKGLTAKSKNEIGISNKHQRAIDI